jgi:N-acetylglucosamine malate deacetylase 1
MRILILSPHTDDAELGAGGTICRFIEEKHELMWIVFSAAEESLPKNLPPDTLRKEFLTIMKYLKIRNFTVYNYKVRYLHEHRQAILESLFKIRQDFKPELVLTTSRHDYHQDHKIVTEETIRAFKNHSSIIGYELPWNHLDFTSSLFVKLQKHHLDKKAKMLQHYKSQLKIERNYFSNKLVMSIARMRGIQCSTDFAESFEVIKWIF